MKWPKFIILDEEFLKNCDRRWATGVCRIGTNADRGRSSIGFYDDRNDTSSWHYAVKFKSGPSIMRPEHTPDGFVYYGPEEDPLIVQMVMAKFLAAKSRRQRGPTNSREKQTVKGQNK